MNVLITGANGFIGKNLRLHLNERKDVRVISFTRANDITQLPDLMQGVDFVFHLAGVNRPQNSQEFIEGNVVLTQAICQNVCALAQTTGKIIPIIYTSSIQAGLDNPYGQSKLEAEKALMVATRSYQIPVHIFRLPNVFGKWCKPNYNSVVSTFCHNIAHGLQIQIDDPNVSVTLVYVDDVIERFVQLMDGYGATGISDDFATVTPQYSITIGELARQIQAFKDSRITLMTERVGVGLVRALYSTYVSYLPPESFVYTVPHYDDLRGIFAEILKTPDCGQFSFFTAYPGITRGGHYHHSKTEKFLVIKGCARFKFRNIESGQAHELTTTSNKYEIVETIPGWTHDITNIGDDEMIVLLWSSEIFERSRPDTFACPL